MMGEEQGLGSSEDDDARVGNAAENGNNGSGVSIQAQDGLPIPQQQPQNSVIRWERFLPIRSLKVLLVENDDSTRQVVSALLRNCSYEVTTAANGLQAWKILENMNNQIDLVLTEVVMPVLSGIGLLSKITIHKTLRNIPVIMMSSHDSMGIVFKCLSKGAVDFLVKPIRKNELKNLWQHVWRRCHSSSGSGSESATQSRISIKSKSAEGSGDNSDSNKELYDNGRNSHSVRDGSDNGSGTQSSWTKKTTEFDCPRQVSHSDQLADAPDSTCAQVIHTKPETSGDKCVHAMHTKQHLAKDEKHDDAAALGKNAGVGKLGNSDEQCDCQHEGLSFDPSSTRKNILSDIANNPAENGHLEHNSENMVSFGRDQGPKSCNRDANCINQHANIKKLDTSNGPDTPLVKDKTSHEFGDSPSLELSLKSMRAFGDGSSAVNDERNVLRHSDLSAFSKYKTASSGNQGPTGNVGSCSPLENSSVAMKTETENNIVFPLSGTVLNQQSNGSSNNDIASTAKNITPKPEALNDKSESSSAFKSLNSSTFQPVQNGRISSPKQVIPTKIEDAGVNPPTPPGKESTQQVQVQHHHHHHHHHYHHHVCNRQQNESEPKDNHISAKDMTAASGQCGSLNIIEGPTEGTAGNYSMNGSGSGSNHGSNGQNGCSLGLNTALTNTESDNKAYVDAGAGETSWKLGGNAAAEDRAAQREAALPKFRQKRKERCFEKKVRFKSRKRLAEQRPRVKGQFVRQSMSDDKSGKDATSNDLTSEDKSCNSSR